MSNWQQITKNSEILETVQGAKIPLCAIPPSTVKNNPQFTQPETDASDNKISKLLQKGVVKPSYHEEGEFISSVFVSSKSDGGYRLILKLDSHHPKKIFICFNESPLKMMKNAFYFILKVLFVLKILKFLS